MASGSLHYGGKEYRPQLLASILRLADELSDESCRADNFALKQGSIPVESVIYHRYAAALLSVQIDKIERRINLEFELNKDDIQNQYGKGFNENNELINVFLLDEIYVRTKKTFLEMLYCMRFIRVEKFVPFSVVSVKISAFNNNNASIPFKTKNYTIRDRGYPAAKDFSLAQLCDDFTNLSGSDLRSELESQQV